MSTHISKPRRIRKWLCYGTLGLAGLAAMAAAGGAWWLWGWRMGSLSFHESWSREHRAALQETADYLLLRMADDYSEYRELIGEPFSKLRLAIEQRPLLARSYAELRRTAADGQAPEHEETGIPMTALAARIGKLDLARELVSRGDSPNNVLHTGVVRESSFQSAIACMPFCINGESEQLPPAERIALLEHMLAHGATLTVPQPKDGLDARHVTLIIAVISAMRGDEGCMAEWLLEKGFGLRTPQDRQDLSMILSVGEGTLPAMRRMVEKYYGELSDTDRYRLLHSCLADRKDAPQKLRWALEVLHADPNATIPGEKSAAEHFSPHMYDDPKLAEEIQRLLLTHGAHLRPELCK